MRKISQEELNEILENHKHWLNEDCDGWENMRANLNYTDLSGLCLNGASLNGASLNGASLYRASLDRASLDGASLDGASLNGASLNGASLNRASLDGASLDRASLDRASLNGASLNGASLDGASLNGASLNGASLNGASLNGASLYEASLDGVKNAPFIPMTCPDTGKFTAYKNVRGYIVKLEIPDDAKRCSATGRKCRCDKAKVLEIQNIDGTKADISVVKSNYDEHFFYTVGEIVQVDNFCEDRWKECSAGIHFFINRQEAVGYRG